MSKTAQAPTPSALPRPSTGTGRRGGAAAEAAAPRSRAFSPLEEEDFRRATELHRSGRLAEAAAIYERLDAAVPDDFRINHLLGALRFQEGSPREAVARLSKARVSRPLWAPTVMCLGVALDAVGRHAEAEKALRLAVRLDPRSFEAWANLGAHHVVMSRMTEAVASYRRSVQIKPDYASGWTGLGSALHFSGRGGDAIACHTRALELDPSHPRARFARAQAWQACQCVDQALADFDAHLVLRPDHHEARSFRLFLLNYRDDLSREALFAQHLAYGRAVEEGVRAANGGAVFAPPSGASTDASASPPRRLRVAFLSPDLRTHSVAFFIEPLLAHLDRSQFEVVLYHDHHCVDAVSERLRSRSDLWRHLAGLAPVIAAEAISADAPDILIDLAGHTGFNRMELFARRLAPVQATYLGYPNTTGLRAMDYRFTDPVADPVGDAELLHTEALVRFAPSAWAYAPPAAAPEPASNRRDGPVTFGSFNALAKLNAGTLRLWRETLAAVPGSRLILKSASEAPGQWSRKLAEAGIPAERVELLPPAPDIAGHLGAYARIDIALDPLPYNGTTTTCEALWMGVPVVTLAGDRHAGRVGASLLTALGHSEWIASARDDYVRIAAGLAADRPRLETLRGCLRQEMRRSVLLDHAGQARRFGEALRQCWNNRRSGQAIFSDAALTVQAGGMENYPAEK